jgi:FMN phosphatase YigB (HAD superfamily)
MHAPVEAVTFDFWNTLLYEPPGMLRARRLEAWSAILGGAGIELPRERLERAFDESWAEYERAWVDNRQYVHEEAIADIVHALDVAVPPDVLGALGAGFTEAADAADLRWTDGIEECLRVLRANGVRIGIVCDVGMTPSSALVRLLDGAGLLPMFDHWSFSDEVGVYKPAPAIFRHALDGLGGPAPERVAHVGDRTRTDVAGAVGMGMIAVRYTGVYDDPDAGPAAHHVLASHGELAGALGLDGAGLS